MKSIKSNFSTSPRNARVQFNNRDHFRFASQTYSSEKQSAVSSRTVLNNTWSQNSYELGVHQRQGKLWGRDIIGTSVEELPSCEKNPGLLNSARVSPNRNVIARDFTQSLNSVNGSILFPKPKFILPNTSSKSQHKYKQLALQKQMEDLKENMNNKLMMMLQQPRLT